MAATEVALPMRRIRLAFATFAWEQDQAVDSCPCRAPRDSASVLLARFKHRGGRKRMGVMVLVVCLLCASVVIVIHLQQLILLEHALIVLPHCEPTVAMEINIIILR